MLGKQSYATQPTEIETPFSKAAFHYDRVIDKLMGRYKVLVALAALLGVLCILLTIGLMSTSKALDVVPVIVRVDGDGQVLSAARLKPENYEPNEREINYFLTEFVRKQRSLPLDMMVARENFKSIYAFMDQGASGKMTDLAKKNDPFRGIGERTRSVEIKSLGRVSANTVQIRWEEKVYTTKGGFLGQDDYTGLFTFSIVEPTDEQTIFVNPLGLYVTDFDISKDRV